MKEVGNLTQQLEGKFKKWGAEMERENRKNWNDPQWNLFFAMFLRALNHGDLEAKRKLFTVTLVTILSSAFPLYGITIVLLISKYFIVNAQGDIVSSLKQIRTVGWYKFRLTYIFASFYKGGKRIPESNTKQDPLLGWTKMHKMVNSKNDNTCQ